MDYLAQVAAAYVHVDRVLLREVSREGNAHAKAVLEELIRRRADLSLKDDAGSNVLHRLCGNQVLDLDLIRLVIAAGIDLDALDGRGRTALHCLFDVDFEEDLWYLKDLEVRFAALRLLAEAGADINIKNAAGRTLLNALCSRSLDDIDATEPAIRELVSLGADVHGADNQGRTALHGLAYLSGAYLNEMLIDKGADIHARDNRGRTPLHDVYSDDNAALLINRGADANAVDVNGWKPIARAFWLRMDEEVIKALMPHTTDVMGSLLQGAPRSAEECRHHEISTVRLCANNFESPEQVLGFCAAQMKLPVFAQLFEDRPILAEHRRMINEAVSSPSGSAVLEALGDELQADRQVALQRAAARGTVGQAIDGEELRDLKLGPLKDDGWERRKHLVCCYVKTREARRGGGAPKKADE